MEVDIHVRYDLLMIFNFTDMFPSVEGAATIGIAIIGYFLVIGFPDTMLASNKLQGFTQQELQIVLDRIDRDRRDSKPDKLTWAKFRTHVANWELWVYGFM